MPATPRSTMLQPLVLGDGNATHWLCLPIAPEVYHALAALSDAEQLALVPVCKLAIREALQAWQAELPSLPDEEDHHAL